MRAGLHCVAYGVETAATKLRESDVEPFRVPRSRRRASIDQEIVREARRKAAERGWLIEPQPQPEWRESHYSRIADRIAGFEHQSK